jgi:F0F1-type ATP synthase assembly protein I
MKHIIEKIQVAKIKEQLKVIRFSIPDLIVGVVIGIIVGAILL